MEKKQNEGEFKFEIILSDNIILYISCHIYHIIYLCIFKCAYYILNFNFFILSGANIENVMTTRVNLL